MVTMPLRQHLFQFLLKTLLQRVLKVKECKTDRSAMGVESPISTPLEGRLLALPGLEHPEAMPGIGWQEEKASRWRRCKPISNRCFIWWRLRIRLSDFTHYKANPRRYRLSLGNSRSMSRTPSCTIRSRL